MAKKLDQAGVLALNGGSPSIKFALAMDESNPIGNQRVARLGIP